VAEPPLTRFEREISEAADAVYRSGKTGYNWYEVDEILQRELEIEGPTRCKKANNSGRAANVITESMDKPIQLYAIFIAEPYTIEQFLAVAKDRIGRFPNAKTIAVFNRTKGYWRARAIVERRGIGLAEQIRPHFPVIEEIHYVDSKAPVSEPLSLELEEGAEGPEVEELAEEAVPAARDVDEKDFEAVMLGRGTELMDLLELPDRLLELAGKRQLLLDRSLATDLLAVVLSSQLVLFAGPSGTGKSTMARLLMDFFASDGRRFEIEALRQWLTPDDLAGYYSVLAEQFATTTYTSTILDLHNASVAPTQEGQEVKGPPILLVEEMNLSAPEGYLAPVVHGLSGISEVILRWELRTGGETARDEAGLVEYPSIALFGPFPRVLGTINVDASAHAPARKVVARSSVVLLEPAALTEEALRGMANSSETEVEAVAEGLGESFLGDPLSALVAAPEEEVAVLAARLREFIGEIGELKISHRSAKRCLAYMAYFRVLSGSETGVADEALEIAVENAFAHCVLPTADAGQFLSILEQLSDLPLVPTAGSPADLGGLLRSRVESLLAAARDGSDFGVLDFWSALS
jgi:DNA polymerase III delta prime subunit